ncbi:reverse transcriptase domain-containing protein [Tanacetum coccineum]
MSVRLADRSFQYPVGRAEKMLVEVGKFTFPADFAILEMEEDSKVPLILGSLFFTLPIHIHVIDEILEEDFDAHLDKGIKILHSIEGTILEEKLFAEFDEFMAMTADENSESESDTEEPPFEKITFNTDYKKHLLKNLLRILNSNFFLITWNMYSWKNPLFFLLSYHLSSLKKAKINSYMCMLAIFHDLIEESIKVFMDDFSVFIRSFDHCLNNLDKMLQRCKDVHLVLNWEKCHFMVKEGIVLGHKVFEAGLEVDKAKIDVISELPSPTNIKGIRSFLGHASFYRRFIKYFSKIARPLTKLLEKDTPFEFNDECQNAFKILKEKLTYAPVIVSLNWGLPFELICDASDFTVRAILADHLSRIENEETSDDSEVDDNFLGETLMEISTEDEPWFADFANYLASDIIPKGMTYQQKKKNFSDIKD